MKNRGISNDAIIAKSGSILTGLMPMNYPPSKVTLINKSMNNNDFVMFQDEQSS